MQRKSSRLKNTFLNPLTAIISDNVCNFKPYKSAFKVSEHLNFQKLYTISV